MEYTILNKVLDRLNNSYHFKCFIGTAGAHNFLEAGDKRPIQRIVELEKFLGCIFRDHLHTDVFLPAIHVYTSMLSTIELVLNSNEYIEAIAKRRLKWDRLSAFIDNRARNIYDKERILNERAIRLQMDPQIIHDCRDTLDDILKKINGDTTYTMETFIGKLNDFTKNTYPYPHVQELMDDIQNRIDHHPVHPVADNICHIEKHIRNRLSTCQDVKFYCSFAEVYTRFITLFDSHPFIIYLRIHDENNQFVCKEFTKRTDEYDEREKIITALDTEVTGME
jgi:hypothetical protein